MFSWWFSQWMPFESIASPIEQNCWQKAREQSSATSSGKILALPVIDIQEHGTRILSAIESKYGPGWRSKPLLFRNMWTHDELSSENRRLSLKGLLQENMVVPYFTNVSRPGALTPDARGRISDIVANISAKAMPHKIGTQLLAQHNPEIIYEVAPNKIVTKLFGNFFSPMMVRISLTVIPIFVAKAKLLERSADSKCAPDLDEYPRTDMHCEPIANILVQLEGEKQITLISPEYSMHLQPRLSPDGRAYIYSMVPDFEHVPRYIHTIQKGEAIYVPTWTWHRVDYTSDKDVAISGSLFHFRPFDFFRRNPLHAAVIMPNLLMELTGLNAQ